MFKGNDRERSKKLLLNQPSLVWKKSVCGGKKPDGTSVNKTFSHDATLLQVMLALQPHSSVFFFLSYSIANTWKCVCFIRVKHGIGLRKMLKSHRIWSQQRSVLLTHHPWRLCWGERGGGFLGDEEGIFKSVFGSGWMWTASPERDYSGLSLDLSSSSSVKEQSSVFFLPGPVS